MTSIGSPVPLLLTPPKPYEIKRSLRFNKSDSAYCSKTPSSAGNRKLLTISLWLKRSELTESAGIWISGTFTTGTACGGLYFDTNDQLLFYDLGNGHVSDRIEVHTNYRLRDTSAWYHIYAVMDKANAATKIYINGVEQTDLVTNLQGDSSSDAYINNTNEHFLGRDSSGKYLQAYIAEMYFVDGTAVPVSSFGETNADTGQWIPKKYLGSYGTNGFYLNFSDNSNTTSGTLGKDSSGNSNDYTPNNFATRDSVIDSPTNNFCTGNPIGRVYTGALGNNPSYSEGSLELETTGNSSHAFGTIAVNRFLTSGCYFEILLNDLDVDRSYFGIVDHQSSLNDASYGFVNKAILSHNGTVWKAANISNTDSWDTGVADCVAGDIIGVAVKGTSIWFHKNGTYYPNSSGSTGNPSTGANATVTSITKITSENYLPYAGYNSDYTWNFGQDSSFAGEKTAQNNTDANGIGDFYYPVPTGFVALCTANLPEPTITKSDENFNIVTYTGTGSDLAVTGVGFQPDLVWIKNRSHSGNWHDVYDSTRGVTKRIFPNEEDAEATQSEGLKAFGSDGFTVGSNSDVGASSNTYVGWNWKESATAGFDIVTYTGNAIIPSGGSQTISHSLGVVPEMIMVKALTAPYSGGGHWSVYHKDLSNPTDYFLNLNKNVAEVTTSTSMWNQTAPTSSVFSVGYEYDSNHQGTNYIGYLFSSVAGFSKVGKFIGNGNTDGPFVYLGFRPAWVMLKRIDAASEWNIWDIKRNPGEQPLAREIRANLDNDESAYQSARYNDFLSNGFKMRTSDTDHNASGGTYVYLAFAKAPFKHANAR